MKTLSLLVLVAAAATTAVPKAQAASLTLESLDLGQKVPMIVDNAAKNSSAYRMNITLDGVSRYAFCVDLFTLINYATYNSNLGTPDMINNGLRVAWLLENYGLTAVTNDGASAVQLAIWDLVHDNGDGFGAGRVQLASTASSNVMALSNLYLTNSFGQSSTQATILFNTSLANGTPAQTLITSYVPTVENPEPSTFLLLGAGVLAIGFGKLRRR
jgi:hypothetical protein